MTTVTRPALLSAMAYMLQAAGITIEELAQHMGQQREQRLLSPLVEPGVDIDAVHRRAPTAEASHPAPAPVGLASLSLGPQAQRVLQLADQPRGTTVADVMEALHISQPAANDHCKRLTEQQRLLTRVKAPGDRAFRYFARPSAAATYLDAAKPAPAPAPQPPAARAQRIDSAPSGLRKPGQPMTIAPPRIDDRALRPHGEAVETAATRRTIDTTRRPNSRIEAAPPLPPDPRFPSFAGEWKRLRGQPA